MIKEKNYVYTDMDAIWSLVGNNVSHPYNSERIYHDGQTPPTEEEIKTEKARLQGEYDSLAFQRARASSYPSLEDVTVALAEKAEGDSTMWDTITAERSAVKKKYPKP